MSWQTWVSVAALGLSAWVLLGKPWPRRKAKKCGGCPGCGPKS